MLVVLCHRLMPHTIIAGRDESHLLATARLALEQQLAAISGQPATNGTMQAAPAGNSSDAAAQDEACCNLPAAAFAGFGDAVLAALPQLLDDPVLLRELLVKWHARLHGLQQAAEAQAKVSNQARNNQTHKCLCYLEGQPM